MNFNLYKQYSNLKNSFDYNSLSTDKLTNSSLVKSRTQKILKSIQKFKTSKIIHRKNAIDLFKNFHVNTIKSRIKSNILYPFSFDKTNNSNNSSASKFNFSETLKLKRIPKNKTEKLYLNEIKNTTFINFYSKNGNDSTSKILSNQNNIINKSVDNKIRVCHSSNLNNISKNNNNNIFVSGTDQVYHPLMALSSSFITSINNKRLSKHRLIYIVQRNENLLDFNNKTRKIILAKYLMNIKRNKLLCFKNHQQNKLDLEDVNLIRLRNIIKLFNPYFENLNEYMIYLNQKIKTENKINDKLITQKEILISEIEIIENKIDKMVHKFKNYLNDKLFLLKVKNSTFDFKKFEQKDIIEFTNDLEGFKYFRNYLESFSENQKIKSSLSISNNRLKTRKITNLKKAKKTINHSTRKYISKRKSLIFSDIENLSNLNSLNNIKYNCKPIFDSVDSFIDKINCLSNNLECLLNREMDKREDLAKLNNILKKRKIKYIDEEEEEYVFYQNNYEYLQKYLSRIIEHNKHLILYKKFISKNKKIRKNVILYKKIRQIIEEVYCYGVNKINSFINKDNINKPLMALGDIEKIINFLVDYKQKEKMKDKGKYLKIVKKVEENNKIYKFKKKQKLEDEKRKARYFEILEKNNRILFTPNRHIANTIYKSVSNKKKSEKDVDNLSKDGEVIDIDF